MCGFAGALSLDGRPIDPASVEAMGGALVHRGPDDAGLWSEAGGRLAFAFRRLAILDLTPAGHQPMSSPDGRFTVVFNGEIYNHLELREELARLGHRFRGTSDTETILAAFQAYGPEAAVPRLAGMFAIAAWDSATRTLFLARDRFGKKPLYYGAHGGTLLFGSELKALRRHPSFRTERDWSAIASYLRLGYVSGERSVYAACRKVPPGCMVVHARDAEARTTRYWSPAAAAQAARGTRFEGSPDEALAELEERVSQAVATRMVADVPVGAFLSGGVDSSLVVALMQRKSTQRVRTFSVAFQDGELNEADAAARVAAHLGTDHEELLVGEEEAARVVPELPRIFDEPFADASQIPMLLVARLARRKVTVALSGDGGDELFGGYQRYRGARSWDLLRRIPLPLRRAGASLLVRGGTLPLVALARFASRAAGGGWTLRQDTVEKLAHAAAAGRPEELYERLLVAWERAPLREPAGEDRPPRWPQGAPLEESMMLADAQGYLVDDVLVKVDRATMAASIEARAPLLDHRLAEFAWSLPLELKIREGRGKWILRRLLSKYVPDGLQEQAKRGFTPPIDDWLRGRLRDWASALLSGSRLEGNGLDARPIRRAWDEHQQGRRSRGRQLWNVLLYQAWCEQA